MFSDTSLGGLLPEKTLCLTFDDGPGETTGAGPGPKSISLGKYLHEQDISATFFVVGKHVKAYPYILPELQKLGHIIGNHTFDHPHLPNFFQEGGELMAEFTKTEELILPYITGDTIYFRAPYGAWLPEIATLLNKDLNSASKYKGPYGWNIDAGDWWHWDQGLSAEVCAQHYLEEISKTTRGIVLMHDSSADPIAINPNANRMRQNNLTFETIKILVAELKKQGYTFINLNQIA